MRWGAGIFVLYLIFGSLPDTKITAPEFAAGNVPVPIEQSKPRGKSILKAIVDDAKPAQATSEAETNALPTWKLKTLTELENDKSIVEAMFQTSPSLWVSRRADGSGHDGFAEYICVLMMGNGMPIGDLIVISIWDAAKMARGDMDKIGRHVCDRKG